MILPETDQTGETFPDELAHSGTATVAAAGLIGIACILMGGDMLNRSLKQLAQRGTSLRAVVADAGLTPPAVRALER